MNPQSWQPDRSVAPNAWPHPSMLTAIGRGLLGRCPACGKSRLFNGFLRVATECPTCGAPLGLARADDAPPYFTILVTGHVIVPLMFLVDRMQEEPPHLGHVCHLPAADVHHGHRTATADQGRDSGTDAQPEHAEKRRQRIMTRTAVTASRLDRVILDGESPNNLSPYIEADREQAVADLAAANHFAPLIGTDKPGPYALHLSILEGRLIFDIRNVAGEPLTAIGLALGPFRRLVKDYQLLVDSHIKAVEEGREQKIQAIDMGRRGLHNEGAELMTQRLGGKIDIDFDTARRLFTLVCVLHQRVSSR